jgi:hypothetical protein
MPVNSIVILQASVSAVGGAQGQAMLVHLNYIDQQLAEIAQIDNWPSCTPRLPAVPAALGRHHRQLLGG